MGVTLYLRNTATHVGTHGSTGNFDLESTTGTTATQSMGAAGTARTYVYYSASSFPGLTDWQTDTDYTWNIDVTTANSNVQLTSVKISRYDSSLTTERASATGTPNLTLSSTGLKTGTVTFASPNPSGRQSTDRLVVTITITKLAGGGTQSANVDVNGSSDSTVVTPLVIPVIRDINETAVTVGSESINEILSATRSVAETSVSASDSVNVSYISSSKLFDVHFVEFPEDALDTSLIVNVLGAQVTSTHTHKFDIIGKVIATKTHKWNVTNAISTTKTHKWNILAQIVKSKTHVWNLLNSIVASKIHKWNTIALVTKTKTHRYDVLAPITQVSTTKTHKWNILQKITLTKTHLYNLIQKITTSKTHKWNTISLVTTTKTHRYNINLAVSQVVSSKTHKWNLIAKVTQSKTHKYDLLLKITKTKTHAFNIIIAVPTVVKTHKWNILAKVTQTKTHKFDLIQKITKSKTHRYDLQGRLIVTKIHRYNLIQKITVVKTHKYSILIKIPTVVKTHLYSILARATISKTHKYNIIGRITTSKTHRWNSGGRVVTTKKHLYDIGAAFEIPEGAGSATIARIKFPPKVRIVDIISDIKNVALAEIELVSSDKIICVGVVEIVETPFPTSVKRRIAAFQQQIRPRHRIASSAVLASIIETIENKAYSSRIGIYLLEVQTQNNLLRGTLGLKQPDRLNLSSQTQIKHNPEQIIKVNSKTQLTSLTRVAMKSKLELSFLNNIAIIAPEIMAREYEQNLRIVLEILRNDDFFR